MKTKHIIKTAIVMAAGILTLTSCEDWLTIYPTDKTVGENFWVKKSDVEEMRAGAYAAVTDGAVMDRILIWGAYRSDELIQNEYNVNTELQYIQLANLYPKQDICSWKSFYKVINRCNIVLNHAKEVMEKDPDFTDGDYNTVRAQMLALRAYCYFYLVRSFRDVPYTEQSYEIDDVDMILPQSAPNVVLDSCITQLKEAKKYILKTGAYGQTDWRNRGYFTIDAVDALLADIYLWRGSMTHNLDDYRNCVLYADSVIDSRDAYFLQYNKSTSTDERAAKYHLHGIENQYKYLYGYANESPFVRDNYGDVSMSEIILEWQFHNAILTDVYNSSVMATQIFNKVGADANQSGGKNVFHSLNDYRYWNFVAGVNQSEVTQLDIRKLVVRYNGAYNNANPVGVITPNTIDVGPKVVPIYDNIDHNWVAYRITDVMLMKAEALVQLSAAEDDESLKQAFNLVQVVNKRSMLRTAIDTLKYESFTSKKEMEDLVLAERERELCFEGKRWYDIVRYAYRQMGPVDITKRMTDDDYVIPNLVGVSGLLSRKFPNGGASVIFKMKTEPSLYWPVHESEIKVNPLLRQNPVFQDNSSTSKN